MINLLKCTCNHACNQTLDKGDNVMIVVVAIILILWLGGMIYDIKCGGDDWDG